MKLYLDQTKPLLGNVEKNLEIMLEAVEKAIAGGYDLIVFPELSLTGNVLEDIVFDIGIKEVPEVLLKKSKAIDIVFGAVEIGEEEYSYNTAFYLSHGEVLGKHRKVYLADYGMSSESRCFMKGNSISAFDTKFGKIGILIGDDFYHQSAQFILAQEGIKYLVVLGNEVATITESKENINRRAKLTAQVNSMLNGVYTIFANRSGIEDGVIFCGNAFVVSPSGEIIKEGETFKSGEVSCVLDTREIRKARIKTPFFKNEDRKLTINEMKRIETNQR